MISRLHITPIVFVVGMAWLVLLLIHGVAVELRWLGSLTSVVPVLLVLLGVFDNWLWKAHWLSGWFTNRPVLCGTWQGTLQPEWVDPRTGTTPGPITCYMVVRQTFSTLSMRLLTSESSSWLIAHNIVRSNDGLYQVAGVYMNKPQLNQRSENSEKRSEIHYGAILLDVQGRPATSMQGHYWTDRPTRGTMHFRTKRDTIFETFEEAHAAFGSEAVCEVKAPSMSS